MGYTCPFAWTTGSTRRKFITHHGDLELYRLIVTSGNNNKDMKMACYCHTARNNDPSSMTIIICEWFAYHPILRMDMAGSQSDIQLFVWPYISDVVIRLTLSERLLCDRLHRLCVRRYAPKSDGVCCYSRWLNSTVDQTQWQSVQWTRHRDSLYSGPDTETVCTVDETQWQSVQWTRHRDSLYCGPDTVTVCTVDQTRWQSVQWTRHSDCL